jgi:hypothetical protein
MGKKRWLLGNFLLALCLAGCDIGVEQFVTPLPVSTAVVISSPTVQPSATVQVTPSPVIVEEVQVTPIPAAGLWVVNRGDLGLVRVDPAANSLAGRFESQFPALAVVGTQEGLWVVDGTPDLWWINPLTGDKTPQRLPYAGLYTLSAAGGVLWSGVSAVGMAPNQPGGVVRIDPLTHQVTGFIQTAAPVIDLSIQGTTAWAVEKAYDAYLLDKIDLATGQIQPLAELPKDKSFQITRAAAGPQDVWALNLAIFEGGPQIVRLNRDNGKVLSSLGLPFEYGVPLDLLVTEQGVWVVTEKGWLLKVDLSGQKLLVKKQINGSLERVFWQEDGLWVQSMQEAYLMRIDPQNGELLAQISLGEKPRPTPSPTSANGPCYNGFKSRIRLGYYARVSPENDQGNRLRNEPKVPSTILGMLAPGERLKVIGGPACAYGWVWWQVKSADSGMTGWTAEGERDTYWLEPE